MVSSMGSTVCNMAVATGSCARWGGGRQGTAHLLRLARPHAEALALASASRARAHAQPEATFCNTSRFEDLLL